MKIYVPFLLLTCCSCSYAARILAIFPSPSYSHQLPLQSVMKALAARGHKVTVLSPDPLKVPVTNYTDIDLSFTYEYFKENIDFRPINGINDFAWIKIVNDIHFHMCHSQLSSPQIKDFIRNNKEKYDLVIHEMTILQCYYGLWHHVGSPPLIGIITLGPWEPIVSAMGNPNHPAYSPDSHVAFSDRMDLWERLYATVYVLWVRFYWHFYVYPQQEAIMRQYFGDAPPPVADVERNVSLLMVGNHWSLDYPRRMFPNVIELAGLHVKKTPSPLPKALKQYLDEAKDGVIYFSLGGNVKSSTMPQDKLQAILSALSELPQRVLWKWELDSLPGQPSNVMLGKWLPQQDILAHPNIRLFITQGGLQSYQEAAYHGVPLVGIPFFVDQEHNVQKYIEVGIGVKVDFQKLSKEIFLEAIQKVLKDPNYRDNMRRLSAVYRDHADSSLSKAVWWTEYVLRHNGAKHLRPASINMAWYQYLLLDVLAVFVGAFIVMSTLLYFTIRNIYRLLFPSQSTTKIKTK